MKEKIEKTDFNEITTDEANELLNELLSYQGDDLKNNIISIIDAIDYSSVDENRMNENVKLIFNNDTIKIVIDELLEEYITEE